MIDLYNDNCLNVLRNMHPNSIDACITDPPYFIDGMGTDWDIGKLEYRISKSQVVGSLPVGMKFDPKQGVKLQEFMTEVATEVFRVLKPGAFFLCFSQGRLYHRMAIALEDSGFEIRDQLIWRREGQAKAFSQDHFIDNMNIPKEEKEKIKASIDGRKTPQLRGISESIVLAQKPKEGTFVSNWLKYGVGLINVTATPNFPSTIFDIPKPNKAEKEGSNHPTMKPVALMEQLIQVFTKPNDTILDCFMGSGTTGVACRETNRSFIGIEINESYFREAEDRIRGRN